MAESFKREDYNSAEERFNAVINYLNIGDKFLHIKENDTYMIYQVSYFYKVGLGKKRHVVAEVTNLRNCSIHFEHLDDDCRIYLSNSPEYKKHALHARKVNYVLDEINSNSVNWKQFESIYDILTKGIDSDENSSKI